MSIKLDRLRAERDTALKKRNDWDVRYQDLDKRYQEQENIEIHDMVHAADLDLEQLARLLSMASKMLPTPEVLEEITKEDMQNVD